MRRFARMGTRDDFGRQNVTQDFEIREYRQGDEIGILDLFNRVFAENNPSFTPRSLAFWRWQFESNPLGHHTFVATSTADRRIVGTYTAIPGTWLHDGGAFVGSQAVDTCVDAEYRRVLKREGLFLSLARAWFDHFGRPERDRIVYGFPNPIAFRIGTRQLDYRPVHVPVVRMVRDFDAAWIDYLGGMGADAMAVEEVDQLPPDLDAAFRAMVDALGDEHLVQRRDAAYLNWRYRTCPTIRYRFITVRSMPDAKLQGVVVMRVKWFDKAIAPLVDWIVDGADQSAIAALAQAAARAAAVEGVTRLETWVPPWSAHRATLAKIGFAPDPSTFNLCIRVFGPRFDEHWAKEHWFFTMGDSDIY